MSRLGLRLYWGVAVRLDLAWVVAPVPCLLGRCGRKGFSVSSTGGRGALAFMYGLSLSKSMFASSTMPHVSPDCLICARFPYHSMSSEYSMHIASGKELVVVGLIDVTSTLHIVLGVELPSSLLLC